MPPLAGANATEKTPEEELSAAMGTGEASQVLPPSVVCRKRAATKPPVTTIHSFSDCTSRLELLAAKAPSLLRALGRFCGGRGFQRWPSVVLRMRNLSFMGSASAKQVVREKQAMESRKKALFTSVYCCSQVAPPSIVLKMRDLSPWPLDMRYATLSSNATIPRKSSSGRPGTERQVQVAPSSSERRIISCEPEAQMAMCPVAEILAAAMPRKLVSTPVLRTVQD